MALKGNKPLNPGKENRRSVQGGVGKRYSSSLSRRLKAKAIKLCRALPLQGLAFLKRTEWAY